MISRKAYYYFALLFPLLVPWLFYPLDATHRIWEFISPPVTLSGIAYIIFIIVAGAWMRLDHADKILTKLWLLPVLFIPFAYAHVWFFIAFPHMLTRFAIPLYDWRNAPTVLFLVLWLGVALYGYLYVILTLLLEVALIRARVIQCDRLRNFFHIGRG